MIEAPKHNGRFVVTGPTRCGKTTLVEVLLRSHSDVVVVDPKRHWSIAGYKKAETLSQLAKELDRSRETGDNIVYRPPVEDLLSANSTNLDRVAQLALERENTLLYYDELIYIAGASDYQQRAPHYYYAVTTGAAKGVGVWGSVQRPSWIPVIALSESDVRATFYLRKESDRNRMEDMLGDEIPWDFLRSHRYSFVMGNDLETSAPSILQFKQHEELAS